MSRAATLASISSTAAIANYGGCCKYAHLAREGGAKKGLQLANKGVVGNTMTYSCPSIKCCFEKEAKRGKKGFEIDNTVYTAHGVQFRFLFLAKSHIAIPPDSQIKARPYKCLICLTLHRSSDTYLGTDELFEHIHGHREKRVGDTPLEGKLRFSNQGAVEDEQFDINLPEYATPTEEETDEDKVKHGVPRDVATLRQKLEDFAMHREAKTASLISSGTEETTSAASATSAATDPSFNPWVLVEAHRC